MCVKVTADVRVTVYTTFYNVALQKKYLDCQLFITYKKSESNDDFLFCAFFVEYYTSAPLTVNMIQVSIKLFIYRILFK